MASGFLSNRELALGRLLHHLWWRRVTQLDRQSVDAALASTGHRAPPRTSDHTAFRRRVAAMVLARALAHEANHSRLRLRVSSSSRLIQYFPHLAHKRLQRKRLLQKRDLPLLDAVAKNCIVQVAGQVKNLNLGM